MSKKLIEEGAGRPALDLETRLDRLSNTFLVKDRSVKAVVTTLMNAKDSTCNTLANFIEIFNGTARTPFSESGLTTSCPTPYSLIAPRVPSWGWLNESFADFLSGRFITERMCLVGQTVLVDFRYITNSIPAINVRNVKYEAKYCFSIDLGTNEIELVSVTTYDEGFCKNEEIVTALKNVVMTISSTATIVEEGKKSKTDYATPIELSYNPSISLVGYGRDTNGNSTLVYEVIKNGKATRKSTQLGGVIPSLSKSEYTNIDTGVSKKVIKLLKAEIADKFPSAKLVEEEVSTDLRKFSKAFEKAMEKFNFDAEVTLEDVQKYIRKTVGNGDYDVDELSLLLAFLTGMIKLEKRGIILTDKNFVKYAKIDGTAYKTVCRATGDYTLEEDTGEGMYDVNAIYFEYDPKMRDNIFIINMVYDPKNDDLPMVEYEFHIDNTDKELVLYHTASY